MLVYLLTCEGEIRPLRSIWDGGVLGITYANLWEEVLGSSVTSQNFEKISARYEVWWLTLLTFCYGITFLTLIITSCEKLLYCITLYLYPFVFYLNFDEYKVKKYKHFITYVFCLDEYLVSGVTSRMESFTSKSEGSKPLTLRKR